MLTKEMPIKRILVVGLGLLGGSIALGLRALGVGKIFGLDCNEAHACQALDLGIVDEIASDLSSVVPQVDCVVVAIPVNHIADVVLQVLEELPKNAWVFDVGSVKRDICKAVKNHLNRGRFIAMHPIAGTEYSGPQAAFKELFQGKINIICDAKRTDAAILQKGIDVTTRLGMRTVFMKSAAHDKHIAYVSHLSHISSFMLGKTVLSIEKEEENIFNMAGSGFESTVRLAKSSPEMWAPIFVQNKHSILKSLDAYIDNLSLFREMIEQEDTETLKNTMRDINKIKAVLQGIVA